MHLLLLLTLDTHRHHLHHSKTQRASVMLGEFHRLRVLLDFRPLGRTLLSLWYHPVISGNNSNPQSKHLSQPLPRILMHSLQGESL